LVSKDSKWQGKKGKEGNKQENSYQTSRVLETNQRSKYEIFLLVPNIQHN
jgi:hypothetical protein